METWKSGMHSVMPWPWTLTFWPQNLTSSSLYRDAPVTKVWRKSVNRYWRYRGNKLPRESRTDGRTAARTDDPETYSLRRRLPAAEDIDYNRNECECTNSSTGNCRKTVRRIRISAELAEIHWGFKTVVICTIKHLQNVSKKHFQKCFRGGYM